ncbi:hypothetical protein FRC08_002930, partial [Ceratobasidium sp. 394]
MDGSPLLQSLHGFPFILPAAEGGVGLPPIDGEQAGYEIQPLLEGNDAEQIRDNQQLDGQIQNQEG